MDDENLMIGYWVNPGEPIPKQELRKVEEEMIKLFKPTLDLDRRTKGFNPLASKLDSLRKVCRMEERATF